VQFMEWKIGELMNISKLAISFKLCLVELATKSDDESSFSCDWMFATNDLSENYCFCSLVDKILEWNFAKFKNFWLQKRS
jgi:hypothetical protein